MVLLGFTWIYWVSLVSFSGFFWFFLGFTGFYMVFLDYTGLYWVTLGFTGLYWSILGSTEFDGFFLSANQIKSVDLVCAVDGSGR